MMVAVEFQDEDACTKHLAVFAFEETATDSEIISFAMAQLDTEDYDMNYVNILKSTDSKSDQVWVLIKDFEVEAVPLDGLEF